MRTIHRNNYDPQLGDYHERIVIDDAREKRWLFDCDGVYNDITQVQVADELGDSPTHAISQRAATEGITNLQDALMTEVSERQAADAAIEQEIQELKDNPDVVDIVATYADLQNYDTSELGDKDVIRVLADETHEGESSYYRWSTDTSTWTFIGATGPYYTKEEVDNLVETETKSNIVFVNYNYNPVDGYTITGFYKDSAFQELMNSTELGELVREHKPILYCVREDEWFFCFFVPLNYMWFEEAECFVTSFVIQPELSPGSIVHCRVFLDGSVSTVSQFNFVKPEDEIHVIKNNQSDFSNDLSVFAANHEAGIYKLVNTNSNSDIALLPKGIEGDPNYQLSIRRNSSVYAVVMKAQGLGDKVFLIGAVKGNYSKVAVIEPDASSKIKLWTQVADNLTTTSNDGQKVLSAYQGKVLADRIGNLSALLTTDKTSAVAAINELVGSGGAATINSTDWSSLWQ